MFALGHMYEYGQFGLERNEAEAMKQYTGAAELGHKWAGRALADSKKMEALKPAAAKGEAEAQGELGLMYRRKNDAEALRLLKLAAARGDAGAINELGFMYQVGSGVERDY